METGGESCVVGLCRNHKGYSDEEEAHGRAQSEVQEEEEVSLIEVVSRLICCGTGEKEIGRRRGVVDGVWG